jgi:hypothetical protein
MQCRTFSPVNKKNPSRSCRKGSLKKQATAYLQQPPVQQGLPGKQHSLFGVQQEAAFFVVALLVA